MNALNVVLERFDGEYGADGSLSSDPKTSRAEQEKAAAYAEGYAAGQAAEKANATSDLEFLVFAATQIEEALATLPNQLHAQLCESLITVLQNILPALSEHGLADEVAAAVMKNAAIKSPGSLTIKAAPEQTELLAKAVSRVADEASVLIEEDATLVEGAITTTWDDTTIEFNIDQAVEQTLASLENTLHQLKGMKS